MAARAAPEVVLAVAGQLVEMAEQRVVVVGREEAVGVTQMVAVPGVTMAGEVECWVE